MTSNIIIACGGTGAHVALAYARLHILGYALDFFEREEVDKAPAFPRLYLIDQDSGGGNNGRSTAWQATKELWKSHPAQYGDGRLNISASEEPVSVTPLPVGEDKSWFKPPYNNVTERYGDVEYLSLLLNKRQRHIKYSLGMMGSPALGSMLFDLKQHDTSDIGRFYDKGYMGMWENCRSARDGRISIVGSAVGGTGAAIAPTLALELSREASDANIDANIMAVMILQWFKLVVRDPQNLGTLGDLAQERNAVMAENEASGLAMYGQDLCQNVASVLVGVNNNGRVDREYTSDNQQPHETSALHAVAALSCFAHHSASHALESGLYGVAAGQDLRKLSADIQIGGGTLRELIWRAKALELLLKTSGKVLQSTHKKEWWCDRSPSFYKFVAKFAASPKETGKRLQQIHNLYSEQVEWLCDLIEGDVNVGEEELIKHFTRHTQFESWLRKKNSFSNSTNLDPARAASAVFEWAARWVKSRRSSYGASTADKSVAKQGYWPQARSTGIPPTWRAPGELSPVPEENISEALEGLIATDKTSHNGWPHTLAVAKHFEFLVAKKDRLAQRKFEILLIGLAMKKLRLEEVDFDHGAYKSGPSIARLIKAHYSEHYPDIAKYRIVFETYKLIETVGFTSPLTLLCPIPDCTDELWERIWVDITKTSDGSKWKDEKWWGPNAEQARKKIGSWYNHQNNLDKGTPPPWATWLRNWSRSPVAFGRGPKLMVYWGVGSERKAVSIAIPLAETSSHIDLADYEEISEEQCLEQVTELQEVQTDKDITFHRVEFQMPGIPGSASMFWQEHLEYLSLKGLISAYDPSVGQDQYDLVVGMKDGRNAAKFENCRVLSIDDIRIKRCIPLWQKPVPNSHTTAEFSYPDLPIQVEFIDLVVSAQGLAIRELARDGKDPKEELDPKRKDRNEGSSSWTMRFKGRSDKVSVTVPHNKSSGEEKPKAHWMIWPKFRRPSDQQQWRAYYLYQHSNRSSLNVSALVVDNDRLYLTERRTEPLKSIHWLKYREEGEDPVGAPPLGLIAADSGEEIGIYLADMDIMGNESDEWEIGVDFGTSHSAVAYKADNSDSKVVNFSPELSSRGNGLSLHISENWDDGNHLENIDLWRPTYFQADGAQKQYIPSELYSVKKLSDVAGSDIGDWVVGEDCMIPGLRVRTGQFTEHILSGFKWDVLQEGFKAASIQSVLRRNYLTMVLELAVAEIAGKRGQLPKCINCMFTYPLRSSGSEINSFKEDIDEALKRAGTRMGIQLSLRDGGLLDESEAAKGGTDTFGEIVLVGDLGGGTLDLFISSKGKNSVQIKSCADSAKIGGDVLLGRLAKKPKMYLPEAGDWEKLENRCITQLKAWVRNLGMTTLFGPDSKGFEIKPLGLKGFPQASDANAARKLIDRYFALVVEYMARSLVAFVAKEWKANLQDDPQNLSVVVQLRGNGWRLWYEYKDYGRIGERMTRWISSRAETLWELCGEEAPKKDVCRPPASTGDPEDPKVYPIRSAVGRSMSPEKARRNTFRFALCDITLQHSNALGHEPFRWFEKLPIPRSNVLPEYSQLDPPLKLGVLPEELEAGILEVSKLDDHSTRRINGQMQEESSEGAGKIHTRIAPLIWEHCLSSGVMEEDLT